MLTVIWLAPNPARGAWTGIRPMQDCVEQAEVGIAYAVAETRPKLGIPVTGDAM